MTHYFFNIVDHQGFVPDKEGEELPNDRAAIEKAEQSARELLANEVLARREIDAKRIEVRDERGGIISAIYLRDLIH